MSKFIKTSSLIGRVCEDYSNALTVYISESPNFVKVTFGFTDEEIIEYRFRRQFYDDYLRNVIQADKSKDTTLNLKSKTTEEK